MISTVVFDMDDTLYDEVEYCKSGFCAVAKWIVDDKGLDSWEEFYNVLWGEFESGNRHTVFNAVLERFGIAYDNAFIQNMVEVYRQHFPSISLPAESEEVLNALHAEYKLALLTDGFLPGQRLKVEALGIEKYFRSIIYTEMLGREYWKPSPKGFEKILEDLNEKSENCIYVGDNLVKDFIAPNKSGFRTVQLVRPNKIHLGEALEEIAKAEFVIKSISELPALLKRI